MRENNGMKKEVAECLVGVDGIPLKLEELSQQNFTWRAWHLIKSL